MFAKWSIFVHEGLSTVIYRNYLDFQIGLSLKTELNCFLPSFYLSAILPHLSLSRTPINICPKIMEALFIIFSLMLPSVLLYRWFLRTVFKFSDLFFYYIQSTMNFIPWIFYFGFSISKFCLVINYLLISHSFHICSEVPYLFIYYIQFFSEIL